LYSHTCVSVSRFSMNAIGANPAHASPTVSASTSHGVRISAFSCSPMPASFWRSAKRFPTVPFMSSTLERADANISPFFALRFIVLPRT
jgi:hypothetical protein